MYNNEVTYHDKWKTKENERYHRKLARKYFWRTPCSSHIPLSWSKEVWELLEDLDKRFGLQAHPYNSVFGWLDISKLFLYPISYFKALIRFKPVPKYITDLKNGSGNRFIYHIHNLYQSIVNTFTRVYQRTFGKWFFNLRNPEIRVDQIKEKFGYLTFYFSAEPAIEKYIWEKISETTYKLIEKGAYHSLDNLWTYAQLIWIDDKQDPQIYELRLRNDSSPELRKYIYRDWIRKTYPNFKPKEKENEST